jgi:hypothetical protein
MRALSGYNFCHAIIRSGEQKGGTGEGGHHDVTNLSSHCFNSTFEEATLPASFIYQPVISCTPYSNIALIMAALTFSGGTAVMTSAAMETKNITSMR